MGLLEGDGVKSFSTLAFPQDLGFAFDRIIIFP